MSAKYVKINLDDIIEEFGEDRARSILADFSCGLNKDVEDFLRTKAIEFSKQSIAKTQLIYYIEDAERPKETLHLVGYFSLTQTIIKVHQKALSHKLRGRISRFDYDDKCYILPVILIGQLGKNFKDGNDKYITGKQLLKLAIDSITIVQRTIAGKFIFLESEDKEKLKEFYSGNGFVAFGNRKLDGDERNLEGEYLLQWLYYPPSR